MNFAIRPVTSPNGSTNKKSQRYRTFCFTAFIKSCTSFILIVAQLSSTTQATLKRQMNCPAHQFSARLTCLTEALAYVATICKQAGLKNNQQLRVELVIEELFTNSVNHGYGENCDHPIWIAASTSNESLSITYQDAAPAYNPLTRPTNINSTIGGLGVTLIETFAHTRYLYENGRNTLILTFHISSD